MNFLSLRYADTLIQLRGEALAKGQEFLTWNDVQKCIDTVNVQVHEEHERKTLSAYVLCRVLTHRPYIYIVYIYIYVALLEEPVTQDLNAQLHCSCVYDIKTVEPWDDSLHDNVIPFMLLIYLFWNDIVADNKDIIDHGLCLNSYNQIVCPFCDTLPSH